MSQIYLITYIGIVKQTSGDKWEGHPIDKSNIDEFGSKLDAQNAVKLEHSDLNQAVYQEMKLIADNTLHTIYDETGAAPISGDQLYDQKFIALWKEKTGDPEQLYTGDGELLAISTDKLQFLSNLRGKFGDGLFRIFQILRQTHVHGFDLKP